MRVQDAGASEASFWFFLLPNDWDLRCRLGLKSAPTQPNLQNYSNLARQRKKFDLDLGACTYAASFGLRLPELTGFLPLHLRHELNLAQFGTPDLEFGPLAKTNLRRDLFFLVSSNTKEVWFGFGTQETLK